MGRTALLTNSATMNGFTLSKIKCEWKGFGTKLLETRQYLIDNPDITHFFFADAYDVIVLGSMEEALSKLDTDKITFSTEKNCWPIPDLADKYPECSTIYKFLNSGLYFAPRDKFLELFDWDMPEYTTDDQLWATQQFLLNDDSGIVLDTECEVFQSYSFIAEDEYSYQDGRVRNVNTGSLPVLFHGNGTTNMDKLYELI